MERAICIVLTISILCNLLSYLDRSANSIMHGSKIAALLLLIGLYCFLAVEARSKRQTYFYPDDLRHYAKTHPGTRIIQGTVGRYAPHEWPAWYTRTLFKWNGHSRLGPYHPNDVRYVGYQLSKFRGT